MVIIACYSKEETIISSWEFLSLRDFFELNLISDLNHMAFKTEFYSHFIISYNVFFIV
jgi:hypothetical protein